jgi:dTMP kinase
MLKCRSAEMLITFEGGEGSGKTTQVELLAQKLRAAGWEVVALREPGGTALGEELRRLLLHADKEPCVEAELLLFLAARAQLVNEVIRPALDRGAVVICDRFSDSTLAYQGYGRGVDVATIRTLNRWATGGLTPDLTVLLDVPVDVGRRRKHGDDDTFHREPVSFHVRVREGYLYLAASEPARWLVVDASQEPARIGDAIWDRARAKLA